MMMVYVMGLVSIQFEALMADLSSVLRYDMGQGQGRAGQGRAGQGRAGQGRAGSAAVGLTVKPVCQKQCAFLIICPGLRALGMHYEGPLQPISFVAARVIMPQVAACRLVHLPCSSLSKNALNNYMD